MTDLFQDYSGGLESPATHLAEATPSDTEDLPMASRGINVATSGSVRLTSVSGQIGTIYVGAGIAFPIRARRIWATGTSATGITVLY